MEILPSSKEKNEEYASYVLEDFLVCIEKGVGGSHIPLIGDIHQQSNSIQCKLH